MKDEVRNPGNGRRGAGDYRYSEDYRHDEFRDDLHKDPGELEREADRARANIESTLEALERRLSPGELLDQMLHVVKDNGGAFGRNLATQVRNNPVPVLLTGIGMTWLMTASDRPPRRATVGYGMPMGQDTSAGYGSALRDKASAIGEGASSAADSARGTVTRAGESARATAQHAREAAEGMAGSVREGAMHARDSARNAAYGLADSSRAGAESLWEGYDYLRREQPLVLGALAVAAGALIGSLLPGTRAEDRLMGEQSDEAMQRLQEEGQRRVDQAKHAAADAAEAARESVQPKRAGRSDMPGGESGSGSSRL
jgi:hypothetical protein